ncbi:hypothetical protein [Yersinia enterocolitica]|uniref:hypothetical protein n=1 Tax=Yersinia enterocolitica TaxID=630 RepID=UPI00030AD77C|nr:hypothetical protein [Yersinia enterocolitica]
MRYHPIKIVSIIGEKILEIEHIVIKQTSYLSFDLYNSIQGLQLVLSDSSAIKGRSNNDINIDDILYIYYLRKFKITQREYTILSLILSGDSNKEISQIHKNLILVRKL